MCCLSALAQDKSSISKFQFGMKASPGVNWLKSETKATQADGALLRASYGFVVNYKLSNNYFFSTGIDVNYKGGKLKRDSTNTVTVGPSDSTTKTVRSQDLKLTYVELPLTMLLKTNEIGYIKYFLQAGLAPGINIRSKYDETTVTTINSPTTNSKTDTDIRDEYISKDINLFNLSMLIGLGVEYNLSGTTSLTAGLSFSNGLLKVVDRKANDPVLQGSRVIANMIALNIGVLF